MLHCSFACMRALVYQHHNVVCSDLRARLSQEAYHMAQLFGSCGRDYSGTELIPEAFNVLGSCQPTSHGKLRPHRHIHTM